MLEYAKRWGQCVRRVVTSNPEMHDLIAKHMKCLTRLKVLEIDATPNLRNILINNTNLRDLRLEHVPNLTVDVLEGVPLPSLKIFSLFNSKCSVDFVNSIITARPNIQSLNLNECWLEGSAALLSFRSCKNLRSLGLANLNLPVRVFKDIATHCLLIVNLDLSRHNSLSDDAVLLLSGKLQHLRTLRVSQCPNLTDLALYYLALHRADTLQVFRMSEYPSVRVSVFVYFLQRCTKLHTLSFNHNTHTYCDDIAAHLHRIVTLSAQYTVSDAFLTAVAEHCMRLQRLNICKYPDEAEEIVLHWTGEVEGAEAEDEGVGNEGNEDDGSEEESVSSGDSDNGDGGMMPMVLVGDEGEVLQTFGGEEEEEEVDVPEVVLEMEIVLQNEVGDGEEEGEGGEGDADDEISQEELEAAGLVRARVEDCPDIDTTDEREIAPLTPEDTQAAEGYYTAEGLQALMNGAPQLRLLCVSGLDSPMASLGAKLWQAQRPQLTITDDYSAFVYDVLEQPL